ncbi:uncharacterized protein Dvir_GJ12295 [Drosophila virilis]|uniref:Chitin-binding type-2 domain-containing protein n=1 Tax=Drosophila virilis TaxID=7244 RepID=B4LEP2_DROVI|nr:uncharacterized protein Dvir_GJ12295 [Drosophila virilis]
MSAKEMKLFGWLLQLMCLWASAKATCNVCNAVNSMACYSLNQTQACDASGLPTRIPYSCPDGYVCVSSAAGVRCQPSSSGTGACQDCNKCDFTRTFACTGTNTFALCLGTDAPQNSVGTCAAGYVCNNRDERICGLDTQVVPTCSYADETTTTTTATTATTTTAATPSTSDASAYCAAVQAQGNYAVGNYTATTCRQYIKCFLLNGSWRGQAYTCPGSTYFSPSSRLCVTTVPATCYTPLSTTTTTTVAPTTSNPNAYCAKMQAEDYYPVGTTASTTCRQYIYCFELNGSWKGKLYTCPGSTYYNSSSKTCVTALPATCTSAVASLSLNGVDLE